MSSDRRRTSSARRTPTDEGAEPAVDPRTEQVSDADAAAVETLAAELRAKLAEHLKTHTCPAEGFCMQAALLALIDGTATPLQAKMMAVVLASYLDAQRVATRIAGEFMAKVIDAAMDDDGEGGGGKVGHA